MRSLSSTRSPALAGRLEAGGPRIFHRPYHAAEPPASVVGFGIARGIGVGISFGVGTGPGIGVSTRASGGRATTVTVGPGTTVTVAALAFVATR